MEEGPEPVSTALQALLSESGARKAWVGWVQGIWSDFCFLRRGSQSPSPPEL